MFQHPAFGQSLHFVVHEIVQIINKHYQVCHRTISKFPFILFSGYTDLSIIQYSATKHLMLLNS